MEQLLYKIPQVGELLGLSRAQVYALVAEGVIPSVRVGSSRRVSAKALHAWVESLPDHGSGGSDLATVARARARAARLSAPNRDR